MSKLDKWIELYEYTKSKRKNLDNKFKRRMELYDGTDEVRDRRKGGMSSKKAYTFRNLVFELIETQIDNTIPQPKISPRDPYNYELAWELEGYLKHENDRLKQEKLNDVIERETYIQGTSVYHIGWDDNDSTPISRGEIFIKHYPIQHFYPQHGIIDFNDAEYCFTEDIVSTTWIKNTYNKEVNELPTIRGMCKLITAYYYNDEGYVCKIGWVDEDLVFDQEFYEVRKIRHCSFCKTQVPQAEVCHVCGGEVFDIEPLDVEIAEEDIVKIEDNDFENMQIIIPEGEEIPYYRIKKLPFVIRKNISKPNDFYGVSDVDILENNQESLNKLHTKMEENVLKAGSIVTKPKGVHIPNTDETLKIVTLQDARQANAMGVFNIQANMQQDDILQDRFYQFARSSLGITDAYQGKRDPTAESGKAKEISAAQAAGRLESKRRMKAAAYTELYELMFKFLLSYSDEKRTYTVETPTGEFIEGRFNRYNFLDITDDGSVYYNDRFLFDVDNASVLSTNRELMWKETTANFQAGTFGHPQDPNTLMLYWTTMKNLGYPLARQALHSMKERAEEMQEQLMSTAGGNIDVQSGE